MTIDSWLQRLSRIPRPELRPFWSARVTAHVTATRPAARASRVMWLYWISVTAIGGPFLLTSWERLAAVAATALALRAVVLLTRRPAKIGAGALFV